MTESMKYAKELMDFIDESPCAIWAKRNAVRMLKEAGFEECDGKNIRKGGKYYFTRGNAVAAFVKGGEKVRIGAAHLDSPAIMLKPDCAMSCEGAYTVLDSELYGGAILSSWLDRPLGIAGAVIVKEDSLMPKICLYKSGRPLCVIPNSPPHLSREINKGYVYTKQRDMLPLYSLDGGRNLIKDIAPDLGVDYGDILDYELYCYDVQKGMLVGSREEMISIGRLDDLEMAYGFLRAICSAETDKTSIVVLTDNEEVGSLTMGGARGSLVRDAVNMAIDDREQLESCVALSADMAHAVNPSHPEFHEPVSRPYLNRGMVLKRAANKSYSTDGISGGFFKSLCRKADIGFQEFVNHSDRPGGTTIGPMISAGLGIPVADIGAPIIAMHSLRELGGVKDAFDSYRLFKAYFEM